MIMSSVMPFPRNPWSDTLAGRLGVTVHVSGLDFRLNQLMARHNAQGAACPEDWLVDVANARGATVVCRRADLAGFKGPSMTELTNEELVVALCRLQALDRPQILRLAGQLISRGVCDPAVLAHKAKLERVEPVLREMALQALRVEPDNEIWQDLFRRLPESSLPDSIIHWSRLAWPVMTSKGCNAEKWVLVK